MEAQIDALRAVPLFAGLGAARLHRLVERSVTRTVAADAVLAGYGEPADRLIVLLSGTVCAVRETADGHRVRLGEFAAPCAVDKAAVLGGGESSRPAPWGTHTATWLAATQTRLRLIPAKELLILIDDVAQLRQHVLGILSRQVREHQEELVRDRSAGVAARTAAWLVRAAGRTGTRVILPGAQQGLAEAVGASRVSVNRALGGLARDGLIRTEPGAVVILAPELLAYRAGAR